MADVTRILFAIEQGDPRASELSLVCAARVQKRMSNKPRSGWERPRPAEATPVPPR